MCCGHGSAFDPEAGRRVEQSPAELPLAAIVLTWDSRADRLHAEGPLGFDSFDRFFAVFHGKSWAVVVGRAPVERLREYSAVVARC